MKTEGALLTLVVSLCLGGLAALAQDVDDAAWDDGYCDAGACDAACCPSCSLYGGAEVAFLKPRLGALGFAASGHPDAMITPKLDYEASPRFWIGFENACGLGMRGTYWQIDSDARMDMFHAQDIADFLRYEFDLPPMFLDGLSVEMEAETADLELTQRACLGCLDLTLAGGVRYARMETGLYVDGETLIRGDGTYPFQAGVAMEFEGVGPTLALDARRPIGCNGLALVGGIRGAWLYGCTDAFLAGDARELLGLRVSAEDHVMQTYEVNLGVEYTRCLTGGCRMSVAALWESQVWEWAPLAGLIHQDVGLTGPTVALSFVR